jgi:hypothetical protein
MPKYLPGLVAQPQITWKLCSRETYYWVNKVPGLFISNAKLALIRAAVLSENGPDIFFVFFWRTF